MTTPVEPITVLLAESSRTQLELLVGILKQDGRFRVVGIASNGPAAIESASRLRPDVIAMAVHLPVLDGYEATRRIMQSAPTPVVMIGSDVSADTRCLPRALDAGALAIVRKPLSMRDDQEREALLTALRLMAGVRVVTRIPRRSGAAPAAARDALPALAAEPRLLAIVASTGGPSAVRQVLDGLGARFPLPILIAQHISHGFAPAFVDWLAKSVDLPVRLAEPGERVIPGTAYVAPDARHLIADAGGRIALTAPRPADRFCPSADALLHSVAALYGRHAIGVVLTGMGDDGAQGLRALHASGGRTLAQDEASSVVYGMPKAAAEVGAVDHIVPLADMAGALLALAGQRQAGNG